MSEAEERQPHPWPWLAAAAVFLGLAVGFFWLSQRALPPPPEITLRQGPTEAQARALEGEVASHPEDPALRLRLGNLYVARGDADRALEPLRVAVEHPATAAAASVLLADWAARTNRHAIALPALQQAVQSVPGDPATWESLIRSLYALGQTGPAEAALAVARRRFPQAPRLRFMEAEMLIHRGRLRRASALYEETLQRYPDPGAQQALGWLYGRMSAPEKAKAAFEKAIELDPSALAPYIGLAKSNLELGHAAEAEQAAYAALQVAPEDPEAIYLLGSVLAGRSGREEARTARELFERALALRPNHHEARYQLGVLQLRAGEARAAARTFEEVLIQQPDRRDARQNYAKALQQAGETGAAAQQQKILGVLVQLESRRDQLIHRIQVAPNDPDLHCDLAEFYLQNDADNMAVSEYERALRIDPDHRRAREGLEKARKTTL